MLSHGSLQEGGRSIRLRGDVMTEGEVGVMELLALKMKGAHKLRKVGSL